MKRYVKLQLGRTIRQKALWIYLIVILLLILSKFSEWKNTVDSLEETVLFPVFCLQLQISITSPLFFALMAAFSINGERNSGMIKQPLLSGLTKWQLLNGKLLALIGSMIFCFLVAEGLSFLLEFSLEGFITWNGMWTSLSRIILTLIPMCVTCIGLVLLAFYTPNITVTMGAALLIFLADNLFSQFFHKTMSLISYSYYAYAFCEFNSNPLESWMIPQGLFLCIITGIVFYAFAYRRIHKIIF